MAKRVLKQTPDERLQKAMSALEELKKEMPHDAEHFKFPDPDFSRKILGLNYMVQS